MTRELPKGAVEPDAPPGAPGRASRREQRWERRRRRRVVEEVIGWIFVPLILLAVYGFLTVILGALGTSPGAVLDGIKAILSGMGTL